MLIDKPEQIIFDFKNRYSESMTTLDSGILFTSGRACFPLPSMEPAAEFLIDFLQRQYIMVFSQKYLLEKAFSEADHIKVREYADFVGKRNTVSIFQALRVYKNYEPLKQRNEYNALYYPELKAYVRFGDLHPVKLLDMLNDDKCDGVVLFRDYADLSVEDRFYIFKLGINQSDYRAIIEEQRERQNEALFEALQRANERGKDIFPELPAE